MAPCPSCGFDPPTREGYFLRWARKYVNHSSEKGVLCSCNKYAFYYLYNKGYERNPRIGRPRLGKTCSRSPEGIARQTARKNRQRRMKRVVRFVYRLQGDQLVQDKINPYKGTTTTTEVVVPLIVQKAIIRLSSLPSVRRTKKPKRVIRTPRARTRTETILRLEETLRSPEVLNGPISRYNALNDRLEAEYLLRSRRDLVENRDRRFIWSDTPEKLFIEEARLRAKPGYKPGSSIASTLV